MASFSELANLRADVVAKVEDSKESQAGVAIALGMFVATIFSTNDSILGGAMSKINRDK